MSAPLVVSIGMTHPQNIAGLGVDVRVARDYGVRHAAVVAAVSAQDESGVTQVFPLPREVVLNQLRSVKMRDAAAVRIGALGTAEHVSFIAGCLSAEQVVIDPVMHSSAGGALYVDDPRAALRLFGGGSPGTIVTPNIGEAVALTGIEIRGVDDMIAAGKWFVEREFAGALIKGGHLEGDPVDVLVDDEGAETFSDARLPQKMRGTGCTLAMALACEIALGRDYTDAVKGARAYVRANIARS
jgi:hydroxymethylpyrimidine/phosphomethylpyrimidine kinase